MKTNLRRLIFIIPTILAVILIAFFAVLAYPEAQLNAATNGLVANGQSFSAWLNAVRKSRLVPIDSNDLQQLQNYVKSYQDFNDHNVFDLTPIVVTSQSTQSINFITENTDDTQFPQGQNYLKQTGINGETTQLNLQVRGKSLQLSILSKPAVNEVIAHGQNTQVNAQISQLYEQLKSSFSKGESLSTISDESDQSLHNIGNINTRLNQSSFKSINYNVTNQNGIITLGDLVVKQTSCNNDVKFTIQYSPLTQTYKLSNLNSAFSQFCLPSVFTEVQLKCSDCMLAPVDKTYALPANYAPKVVPTNLPGGGNLLPEARDALTKLISNAKGLSITILSSYRSYQDQQTTFNYWVNTEIAKGYSRSEAEQRANVYSAKPGHSEHQLGTTVDLRCSKCNSFDNSPGNLAVYKYLSENSYKYGFVISYPNASTPMTGYTYEPWHIRYVGIEQATQIHNQGFYPGFYLAKLGQGI